MERQNMKATIRWRSSLTLYKTLGSNWEKDEYTESCRVKARK
jgi:hypothetical protein